MPYADLATVQATDPGDVLTAAWCDQVRDNEEFFIDPPACSVFHNAAVSLTDNTLTTLSANSETFDNDSMHSTVSNNSRITFQTSGRYLIVIKANFASSATGTRLVGLLLNGSSVDDIQINNAGASQNTGMIYTATQVATAGDFIQARARHTAGAPLNVTLVEFAAIFLTR